MERAKIEDKKLVDRLIRAVESGNYRNAACAFAGIHRATFYNWINQAEADREAGVETVHTAFLDRLEEAEEIAEANMVRQWRSHFPDDWRAIATFLERRRPERWGRVDRLNAQIQASGELGLNIVIDTGAGKPMKDYADILEDEADESGDLDDHPVPDPVHRNH